MINRVWNLSLGLPLALLLFAPRGGRSRTSVEELKKEIQALSQTIKAMQKDLQDIKALLQSRMPAPPPQNVLLDLDSKPSRGNATARLTLVEFSDYQ